MAAQQETATYKYRPKGVINPAADGVSVSCPASPCGAHYWSIAAVHGPTSPGECRYCHKQMEFHNSVEGMYAGNVKAYFPKERVEKLERVENVPAEYLR